MKGRVFILGLDGGEWSVLDYLLAAGQLPNFRALIDGGVRRRLRSTTPPMTPAAWASFYTGTNPGRTGVIDFLARREGSYSLAPVHRAWVNGHPLWEVVGAAGKKSLVVNVPMTYPPDKINGVLVAGMDTPSPLNEYTQPRELKGELLRLFPRYAPDVHVSRHTLKHQVDLQKWYIDEVLALEETRAKAIEYLMQSRSWDLAVAVLVATDRLQHVFWHGAAECMACNECPECDYPGGAVFEAYRLADRFLGRLSDMLRPEDHLMILSDHGFGPLDKDVNLNMLLAQLGFLRFRRGQAKVHLRQRMVLGLKDALPGRMRELLWRLRPAPETKPMDGLSSLADLVDWKHTRAYAVGYLGGICVNLQGREPGGIVTPSQRDDLLGELTTALAGINDPEDGRPLVTEIHRREELYSGPAVGRLPDLILTLKDHHCTARPSLSDPSGAVIAKPFSEFGTLAHSGSHRPYGIFIGHGPRFRDPDIPESPDIMDLFPTTLDLLGIPLPPGLDGTDLFDQEQRSAPTADPAAEAPASPRARLTSEEEGEVLENLKGLGYF